jgi:hypothetical protein
MLQMGATGIKVDGWVDGTDFIREINLFILHLAYGKNIFSKIFIIRIYLELQLRKSRSLKQIKSNYMLR